MEPNELVSPDDMEPAGPDRDEVPKPVNGKEKTNEALSLLGAGQPYKPCE